MRCDEVGSGECRGGVPLRRADESCGAVRTMRGATGRVRKKRAGSVSRQPCESECQDPCALEPSGPRALDPLSPQALVLEPSGPAFLSSGISETRASVVSRSEAIDEAF